MSKNRDLAAQLAEMNKSAVKDDPHDEQGGAVAVKPKMTRPKPSAASTKKSMPKKKAAPKKRTGQAEQGGRGTVVFNASAMDALGEIQAFLMTKCKAKSTNVSMAVCLALDYLAAELPSSAEQLRELYEKRLAEDGRKKRDDA